MNGLFVCLTTRNEKDCNLIIIAGNQTNKRHSFSIKGRLLRLNRFNKNLIYFYTNLNKTILT